MQIALTVLGLALIATLIAYGVRREPLPIKNDPAGVAAAVESLDDTPSGPAIAARKDLANRLRVPAESIAIVSETERIWRDTCLGLPEAGESCAAMQIPGYHIQLRAAGAGYSYRTDTTGTALRYE
jgi:hypothetical protein